MSILAIVIVLKPYYLTQVFNIYVWAKICSNRRFIVIIHRDHSSKGKVIPFYQYKLTYRPPYYDALHILLSMILYEPYNFY